MGWLKGLTSDGLTADGRNAHALRYTEGMLNRVGERRGGAFVVIRAIRGQNGCPKGRLKLVGRHSGCIGGP